MKNKEPIQLIIAVLILTIVIGFGEIVNFTLWGVLLALFFSLIIISVNVSSKIIMASRLDAGVEHEIWNFKIYNKKSGMEKETKISLGVIIPLVVTALTLGLAKVTTILTYETTALKRRAAKRFGNYSYTEMTEWHNALIGATGIIFMLLIAFVSYWIPGLGALAKAATFYAFFNMFPISKLDGAQIFFGSRVLWATLATITTIFALYALLLV